MNISKPILFLIAFLAITNLLMGQDAPQQKEKLSLEAGSIESQFDYVIKKSNRYETYKVVKIDWLNKLKGNVSDSLSVARNNLQNSEEVVNNQKTEIASLKLKLQQLGDKFEMVTTEKNSISLFGKLVQKSTYNSIMWTIAAILLAAMLFFLLLFKRSNAITVKTKLSLKDTQDEFDAHRKRALEREQKLARKLHDVLYKDRK